MKEDYINKKAMRHKTKSKMADIYTNYINNNIYVNGLSN